jgi:hypothetical protein
VAPDPLDVVAARYLTGRPLRARLGRYPYLSRGDARWAGWQRQMVRLTLPGLAAAAAYGSTAYPGEARVVATGAAIGAYRWGRVRLRQRRFRRAYISPTVKAIRVPVGTADVHLQVDPGLGRLVARLAKPMSPAEEQIRAWYGRRVEPVWRRPAELGADAWDAAVAPLQPRLERLRTWLSRPRPTHGPRIRLTVAAPYVTSEQRSLISAIVKAKVPAGDMVESWDQVGAEVTATWTPRRRPPKDVGLVQLEVHGTALPDHQFYLGQGAGDVPVILDLHNDSPHIALSAGTGAGKSVLAQQVAVQILRRGGRVIILDRKGSHRWALDLPGVQYCIDADDMHEALISAAAIADRRNREAIRQPEDWDPGQRILVICEELNATIGQLAAWWADNRDKSDPKRSPAIAALGEIAFMGRSAKVHLLAIAQMLTARSMGGPEARENFGIRCLARYTANNWKMLVPEAAMPRSSRTLGRWQIVVGGVATETQVCYLSPAEARAYARPDVAATTVSPATSQASAPIKATSDVCDGVTLREAVDRGLVPGRWNAVRKRLERDAKDPSKIAPAPIGERGQAHVYDPAQLAEWVATR